MFVGFLLGAVFTFLFLIVVAMVMNKKELEEERMKEEARKRREARKQLKAFEAQKKVDNVRTDDVKKSRK